MSAQRVGSVLARVLDTLPTGIRAGASWRRQGVEEVWSGDVCLSSLDSADLLRRSKYVAWHGRTFRPRDGDTMRECEARSLMVRETAQMQPATWEVLGAHPVAKKMQTLLTWVIEAYRCGSLGFLVSREELASLCGVARSTIGNWLNQALELEWLVTVARYKRHPHGDERALDRTLLQVGPGLVDLFGGGEAMLAGAWDSPHFYDNDISALHQAGHERKQALRGARQAWHMFRSVWKGARHKAHRAGMRIAEGLEDALEHFAEVPWLAAGDPGEDADTRARARWQAWTALVPYLRPSRAGGPRPVLRPDDGRLPANRSERPRRPLRASERLRTTGELEVPSSVDPAVRPVPSSGAAPVRGVDNFWSPNDPGPSPSRLREEEGPRVQRPKAAPRPELGSGRTAGSTELGTSSSPAPAPSSEGAGDGPRWRPSAASGEAPRSPRNDAQRRSAGTDEPAPLERSELDDHLRPLGGVTHHARRALEETSSSRVRRAGAGLLEAILNRRRRGDEDDER